MYTNLMKALIISFLLVTSLFADSIINLPPGLTIIEEPMYIEQNNVTIVGDGSSVLKLGKHKNCPIIVVGERSEKPTKQINNIKIINVVLDGNKDFQDSEYMPLRPYLRNNCLTVRGATNVYIENIVVSNARSGGVVFELGTTNSIINGINAHSNYWDGFAACDSTKNMIRNGLFHSNHAAGISLDWRTDNNIFSDLIIENNGDQGIFMRDCRNNYFKNIALKYSGIFLGSRDINYPDTACFENIFLLLNQPYIEIDSNSAKNKNLFLLNKIQDKR